MDTITAEVEVVGIRQTSKMHFIGEGEEWEYILAIEAKVPYLASGSFCLIEFHILPEDIDRYPIGEKLKLTLSKEERQ